MRDLATVVCCVAAAAVFAAPDLARAAAVAPGFLAERVALVPAPTTLVDAGAGTLLVASQSGQIWTVAADGGTAPEVALDLGARTCDQGERGVLGLALDPADAQSRFLYVFYTARVGSGCPDRDPTRPANRVSRFSRLADPSGAPATADPSGASVTAPAPAAALAFDPSSEETLLDGIPSFTGYHNGGDLVFGRDGLLYVSVGDSGCDWVGDSGCSGGNDAAEDRRTLVGKILRITANGAIPPDNPFQGEGTVRCHRGSGPAGSVCREIFALGLRNPFRIAADPNAAGTRIYVNDVGQNAWEEIDELAAGADYGWNRREGPCANDSLDDCGPPPPGVTNPIFAYPHDAGCSSITGGAFVPADAPGAWGDLASAYLFGDYVCGRIFRLREGDGANTAEPFASDLGGGGPVSLRFVATADAGLALYYTTYDGGGEVWRIIADGGNRPPEAHLAATPAAGDPPLTVSFDASASRDPEGGPLVFRFDFGDGSAAVGGESAQVDHVYAARGTFRATVEVRDDEGAVATASATVRVGEAAPVITWLGPGESFRFRVGVPVTLRVRAVDREDGVLPPSAVTWTVLRQHGEHTHPFVPETTGRSLRVVPPPPEDLAAVTNSHLVVRVVARDRAGNETALERLLLPAIVPLTFATRPSGLAVRVNGTVVPDGAVVRSWVGWRIEIAAFDQQDAAGVAWTFTAWSDRGRARHQIKTPARAARYVASYSKAP